ncbi:protein SCO1/2 [Oryzomicrobium terrae]|uniref:Protein SCO1/2 n=1 Tax=Oryzomicrobium terrae TaxID=1735038 RepID=A0A5C1E7N1_9RHOO|nr:SCO family protein [Oryzomicrobium terrae]QEL64625.1 protein SCO1/2 [Oryzomicrobium terrae]
MAVATGWAWARPINEGSPCRPAPAGLETWLRRQPWLAAGLLVASLALAALAWSGPVHAGSAGPGGEGEGASALFAAPAVTPAAPLDLAREAAAAKAEGKRLALYFELPDCPGCARMKREVFPNAAVLADFGRRYRTIKVDLAERDGHSAPLVDPQGQRTSAAQLADRYRVLGTPGFLFFDGPDFRYRHVGPLDAVDFRALGRFVTAGAFEQQPFADYRLKHRARLLAEGTGAGARAGVQPLPTAVLNAAPAPEVRYAFTLNDVAGPRPRERRLADYRGKVVALAVGYTQCPDVCPTTLAELKAALAVLPGLSGLGTAAQDVQVLFATLDPERDTPALLGEYVGAFDKRFAALRGDARQTAAFIRDFGLVADKQPSDALGYTLDHTAGVFLIDRQGRVRGLSPYGQPVDLLAADLAALVKEGRGRSRPARPAMPAMSAMPAPLAPPATLR